MELKRIAWFCAMCEQDVDVHYSGSRIPFREHPKRVALRQLLAKAEDHMDFHVWQFGNEIDSAWLEEREQEQGMDDD